MTRRADPQQLEIDWGQAPAAAVPVVSAGGDISDSLPAVADHPCTANSTGPSKSPFVQRLTWDFKATFPPPTEDAIEAGILQETDRDPENLKILHQNYANHALTILRQLDHVMDARRRGVDPMTGKKPKTHAARERLRQYLDQEPGRLERGYAAMLGSYTDGFGDEAAQALDKALRAWHGGVEVVADAPHGADHPVENLSSKGTRRAPRLSSVLPVPTPLTAAVAASAFGKDENGQPVRPDAAEVRAITENHAERIIDLIETVEALEKRPRMKEADEAAAKLKAALDDYAKDFGEPAAKQLERYSRRQVQCGTGRRR